MAITALLAGCASADCSRSFCGCYTDHSQAVKIRLTDAEALPISDAVLICEDTGVAFGTTDEDGLIRVTVEGQTSPGCGFIPSCQIAYFRTEENSHGRPFWFGRLIRGSGDAATGSRIEIITDGG